MTILASNSQIQSSRSKSKRDMDINRCIKSKSRNEITKSHHNDTESDTSISPINEFSNMSTYRVPTKSRGGKKLFHLYKLPSQFLVFLETIQSSVIKPQ